MAIAKPKAAPKPESTSAHNAQRRRRNADLDARARQGELPPPPDFSAPTHARFRSKLESLTALAERGDSEALRAVTINPVSSSPICRPCRASVRTRWARWAKARSCSEA